MADAEKKTAVFRCDAARHIGGGHVMRCLTLAGALKKSGFSCRFIVNPEAPKLVKALETESVETDVSKIFKTDILIVDHYGLDAAYEKTWRSHVKKIVVIDDLADRVHECDILIDQTYGRPAADYNAFVPKHCKTLVGADYTLLRPDFAVLRPQALARRKNMKEANRVLLSFGLGNFRGVTEFALNALATFKKRPLQVDVVLGGFAENLEGVKKIIAAEKFHTIKLHIDAGDMAQLMADTDIAIGAGGTTSWERCALGLPTLVIQLADNQAEIAKHLTAAGAIKFAGKIEDLNPADLAAAFSALLDDANALKTMAENASHICDGTGAGKVVNEVLKLL